MLSRALLRVVLQVPLLPPLEVHLKQFAGRSLSISTLLGGRVLSDISLVLALTFAFARLHLEVCLNVGFGGLFAVETLASCQCSSSC